jgi:hypothetical protein
MGSQPRNHGNPDPRAAAASAPAPSVEFSPRSGATDVAPDQPVALAADHARLTSVTLRAADGTPVAGTAGADGRSWRAGTPLRYGTTYTWSGQAAGRAMTVQTSIPTPGSWAWLDDDNGGSRAHWRPQNYWTSGTQVAVTVSGPRCRR